MSIEPENYKVVFVSVVNLGRGHLIHIFSPIFSSILNRKTKIIL